MSPTPADSGLSLKASADYTGTLKADDLGWITPIDLADGTALLTGGGTGGNLVLRSPGAGGSLPAGTTIGGTNGIFSTLQHSTVIDLANGNHVVYGGVAGQTGMVQITFNDADSIVAKRTISDLTRTYAADVAGTAQATVGGNTYLFTASATEHGVSTWSVAGNGNLLAVQDMAIRTDFGSAAPPHWSRSPWAGKAIWCWPVPAPTACRSCASGWTAP